MSETAGGVTFAIGSPEFVHDWTVLITSLGMTAHTGYARTERVVEGEAVEAVRSLAVFTEPGAELPHFAELAELTGATAVTFGTPGPGAETGAYVLTS